MIPEKFDSKEQEKGFYSLKHFMLRSKAAAGMPTTIRLADLFFIQKMQDLSEWVADCIYGQTNPLQQKIKALEDRIAALEAAAGKK